MASSNISSLIITSQLYQDKLTIGFSVIQLIFGVPGCFLNILLFSRRQFRTVSCCTYFLVASVVMFIQLSVFSVTGLYAMNHVNPINYILVWCKIWNYFQQAVIFMSRWILAVACVDRYALSSTNARVRHFASVHVSRRVVAVIIIMWFIFTIPVLVFFDIRGGNCVIIYGRSAVLFGTIFTIINSYVIPTSIMIIFTLLIRQSLANKRVRRQNFTQNKNINDREDLQRRRDQQALVMLITQIIIYIVLTTPWFIGIVYLTFTSTFQNKSHGGSATSQLLNYVIGGIILFFPAASFYSYTLTSNMFRKELVIMLHSIICWKSKFNIRRIEPLANHGPLQVAVIQ